MQGITPKKSYGQNFLNDKNIIHKIIKLVECKQDDLIIEIGPGQGALTEFLLLEPINLLAVEFDMRAVDFLYEKFIPELNTHFELINDDIRNINIQNILAKYNKDKLKVIGNIPYNISSDILFWLFEQSQYIDKAIIMIQKEVAQRIVSVPKTKDYGILTIAADLVGNTKKAFDVSPSCFYPKPKVNSSVIEFAFNKNKYDFTDFKKVMQLVKSAFNQRRKVLKNSLRSYFTLYNINDLQDFFYRFPNMEVYFTKRAEELTTQDFLDLYYSINKYHDINKPNKKLL